jgi:hypothetical protein
MKPDAILFSSSTRYPHGMLRLILQIKPFPFRDIDRKSTLDKKLPGTTSIQIRRRATGLVADFFACAIAVKSGGSLWNGEDGF